MGPTVWELEGPIPILKMSKMLIMMFSVDFIELLLPFRPRMPFVVNLCQMIEIQFGVNLRGREVAVSQKLLHGADVA